MINKNGQFILPQILFWLSSSSILQERRTLGKSVSPPFLLTEGKMKWSVLLMAGEKKGTQRKQSENSKRK